MRFLVVLFAVMVLTGLWWVGKSQFRIQVAQPDIETSLQTALPPGVLIRDFSETNSGSGKWLVLYVESGFVEDKSHAEGSCQREILGISISGKYHLALVENNILVNEVAIPKAYNSEVELELRYKNFQGEESRLMTMQDLNGDGYADEFLLTTIGAGCSMYDGLVAGYDREENRARLYSGWLYRFQPDIGKYGYIFECGDHGNSVRSEVEFGYNPQTKMFEQISRIDTECEGFN